MSAVVHVVHVRACGKFASTYVCCEVGEMDARVDINACVHACLYNHFAVSKLNRIVCKRVYKMKCAS